MSILSRMLGAAIAGGGTYAGLAIFAPQLGVPLIAGISAVMAILGLFFGPAIWEAVAQLL